MYRISIIFFLALFLGCQSAKLQKDVNHDLLIILEDLVEESLIDHIILSKDEVVFLISSSETELKVLVSERSDINELLALLDDTPIGYIKEDKYDALFFDNMNNIVIKSEELPNYIDKEKISNYKKGLNWTSDSGTPPPVEPANLNPYVYVYKMLNSNSFILINKGNNIDFP